MELNDLDLPFSPSDIEWRAAQVGESNGKCWVKCLAYINNRAIQNRLDDVCGKGGWRNEFRDIANNGGVECGLSIKIGGEWVTKWDAAENTNIEAVKGGRSSAMKRAGSQWGIGRYLYDLTEGWGLVCDNGAHSSKTKSNKWFKWNPPALPAWALPQAKVITVEQLQAHILKHNQTIEAICSGYGVGSLAEIADKQLVIDETSKWEIKQ